MVRPWGESGGRVILTSWGHGKGCYRASGLLQRSGYYIMAWQEAVEERVVPESWGVLGWRAAL
eukprot:3275427-Alexandrium_andersonii.AAC.1